jgi:hypothetical protein
MTSAFFLSTIIVKFGSLRVFNVGIIIGGTSTILFGYNIRAQEL